MFSGASFPRTIAILKHSNLRIHRKLIHLFCSESICIINPPCGPIQINLKETCSIWIKLRCPAHAADLVANSAYGLTSFCSKYGNKLSIAKYGILHFIFSIYALLCRCLINISTRIPQTPPNTQPTAYLQTFWWIIWMHAWRSILMCNISTFAGTSLEGTPMFAHVTLHRTFNPLGSKCPWWQDVEAAS